MSQKARKWAYWTMVRIKDFELFAYEAPAKRHGKEIIMEKFLKHMSVIIGTTVVGLIMLFYTNAMAVPAADTVKEVIDYYYHGQEQGPILAEAKICKTVEALECVEGIDPGSFPMGETIKVWMQFLVPKGATYDDILVEYRYEGTPWRVQPHKVESSIRYRVVDSFKLDKSGNWTITIKKGPSTLKSFNVKVSE
ncbi:MAG: hypothetical protein P8017_12440 [Deltaproteobacteria bacterium]